MVSEAIKPLRRWQTSDPEQYLTMMAHHVGVMYANAEGLEQNNAETYKRWMLAMLQRDRHAEANMEIISARLIAEECVLSEGMAADWIAVF
ncbi:MAG: hypothetical protein GY746_13360 [Gammaproteobacteria bacterium]|nr:hypothetical protein [Gammaproteobacteria bacterium]MCP4277184.1 hypothetical protein [Gammaproteobacteria bacterium]MCP4928006.1 hypothetical protein [Gammaproteobacteria bacterium]